MSVVVVNEIPQGSQDFYDRVNPKVMPDGQLPEGCQLHIAGPSGGGWRVITVWDSEEQFQQFRAGPLGHRQQDVRAGGLVAGRNHSPGGQRLPGRDA